MYEPPSYVLLQPSHPSTSVPTTFVHPAIEYHFADDPATALLPSSEHESVIVIDYPGADAIPTVQSLYPGIAVSGVKVVDAPGVPTGSQGGSRAQNDKMYIIGIVSGLDGGNKEQCVIPNSLQYRIS